MSLRFGIRGATFPIELYSKHNRGSMMEEPSVQDIQRALAAAFADRNKSMDDGWRWV